MKTLRTLDGGNGNVPQFGMGCKLLLKVKLGSFDDKYCIHLSSSASLGAQTLSLIGELPWTAMDVDDDDDGINP